MTNDDVARTLAAVGSQFNFNEYETEAYMAVLEHGRLTASEIAERTDIPQPRVYDTVRSLAEHGFVEIRESRPIEVLAVDPTEAFSEAQSTLEELAADLKRRYTAPSRGSEAVSLVTSRRTILRYLKEVITAAEYELVVSLTPDLLSRFEEELRAKRDAGVTIDLLLAPESEVPDAESFNYSRVATTARARRGLTTPIMAVADGDYSVYTVPETLEKGQSGYGVIFNRSELGFLVSGFLNTVLWPSASTLVEQSDGRTFPRRYASIRRCVQDIAPRDESLYVTVHGRDVETGTPRTVSGRIVDVDVGRNQVTASLTVRTDDGDVDVGGQAAALEDIEAAEIVVDRDSPPETDS